LPFMLSTLKNQGVKLEKDWAIWLQAATEMIDWSKLPLDLSDATTAIKSASSELQTSESASIRTKHAPRKAKQAKTKPIQSTKITKLQPRTAALKPPAAQPKSRPTALKTAKSAKTPKPAATAKVAAKTVRSSSPRSAGVSKTQRRAR